MPPEEWLISRICEEFQCLPSEAINEPLLLCLRIIEQRAYARAKDIVDHTEKASDLPNNAMVEMVQDIEFDIAQEARDAKH